MTQSAESAAALKQACLDLSNAALALFDQLDEHGTEAPWVGGNVLTLGKLTAAHEEIRSYFARQAVTRLSATSGGRALLGEFLRSQSDGSAS